MSSTHSTSCKCSFLFLFIYFLFLQCDYANCEWFSSLGQMEDLVIHEAYLVSSLREYIMAEEVKLEKIKRLAEKYEQISSNARADLDQHLGHPVNQYRLVKRLALEWSEVEELIKENVASHFLSNLTTMRSYFPNEDDVTGSAQAIMRLQDTYKLDVHEIAQGFVRGLRANQSLTAADCFDIGRTAYLEKDYHHCVVWMREVAARDEETFDTFTRFDVLDHLSYCLSEDGNVEQAYQLSLEMLEIDPSHQRTIGNSLHYKHVLDARKKGDDGSSEWQTAEDSYPERTYYERLCRREGSTVPSRVEKQLKCYLWTNSNHPRLALRPVKMEELWHSPHLVRFYDVVRDDEIDIIKRLAKPRLNRATVQNPATGKLEHAKYRVSKSAWLTDETHEAVARVCQRIEDITGLAMSTAEELQIANYGVGGQYEPHYDFARVSDAGKFDADIGNRIATFLIYLSDVNYGGSTVFLNPGVAVPPIKGSAAFWYNLFPSGAGDLRTRHAACPVLAGVKWVSNKWIHERDQEFRRSCRLNRFADNRIF